ncbi:MAG: sterol carrier family protein [Actinomycetaceae bacterium]|nr:sterol carrier family protein [Actinomycetaceae bacterium]
MPKKITAHEAMPLLARASRGEALTGSEERTAARFALQELAQRHPGRSVEIRVPFAGAVQIGDGPTHRRGTPPNVVEISASTLVDLATGRRSWQQAFAAGDVSASGIRADLSPFLPLFGHEALSRWVAGAVASPDGETIV